MSLRNIFINMASHIYNNTKKIGDLTKLTTAQKTSIVAAINELSADLAGRENIDAVRVEQIAKAELAKLTNGASAAFDTLAEIEAAFGANASQVAALLTEIGLVKTKNEALTAELAEVKAYIGWDERETLATEINRLMNADS